MYHCTELYRFSFTDGGTSHKKPPELIVTIHEQQLSRIALRLALLADRLQDDATLYFDGTPPLFIVPKLDLFLESTFGYAHCGYVVTREPVARLHLPLLGAAAVAHTAFTLQLLKTALLATDPEDVSLSTQPQQFDLDVCTDNHRSHGYGHALGGYLSHTVTAWLQDYRARDNTPKYHNGDAPMHPAVVAAMTAAWRSTARASWQEYAPECRGRIAHNGAFILECFGNACDVGVYPSELQTNSPSHTVSCHNLDTAEQQLTLLAGLAKICQLARGDTPYD